MSSCWSTPANTMGMACAGSGTEVAALGMWAVLEAPAQCPACPRHAAVCLTEVTPEAVHIVARVKCLNLQHRLPLLNHIELRGNSTGMWGTQACLTIPVSGHLALP